MFRSYLPPISRTSVLAAFSSAALLALAFPRPSCWPLIFVGLSPLLLAVEGKSVKESVWCGFLAGFFHSVLLLYWLVYVLLVYGHLPYLAAGPIFILLVGYLALYPALFIWGLKLAENYLAVSSGSWGWIFSGAAFFTALDYIKGFLLTGFPWEPLGAALVGSPIMVQAADVIGTGGLTFLVVLVNLALAGALLRWKIDRPWAMIGPLILVLLVPALLAGYGHLRRPEVIRLTAQAPKRNVAVIQAAIDLELKWEPDHRIETLVAYRDLTFAAGRHDPWLTIWPETAAPFFFLWDIPATDWLTKMVKANGHSLLFGAPAYERTTNGESFFNRAYLMDDQARVLGFYDKVHLVPFGEYVPFGDYFPFLGKISQATGNYQGGEIRKILDFKGEKIGVLICYESIFPGLARRQVLAGADYLVVMTNDAWFGYTSAPYQHFSQAVLRAVENRRGLIRAANTGISGIILPSGEVTETLGLNVKGHLNGQVPRMELKTIYSTYGDIIPYISLTVTAVFFGLALFRRRHAGRSETAF